MDKVELRLFKQLLSVPRLLAAASLAFSLLASNAPAGSSASAHLCAMACCAGLAPD